jgi:hypothetical protein
LAIALRTLGEVTAAGAWGEKHKARGLEYFMNSIRLCKELGSDVELARSYRALADFVMGTADLKDNSDLLEQAATMASTADEIFARLKNEPQAAAPRQVMPSVVDGRIERPPAE